MTTTPSTPSPTAAGGEVASPRELVIDLLSDTAFARGEPTAAEVDVEVEHDQLGLPFVGGKTLHGLLRDSWLSLAPRFGHLSTAAARILGRPGSLELPAILHLGDGTLGGPTPAPSVAPAGTGTAGARPAAGNGTGGTTDATTGQRTRRWLERAQRRTSAPITAAEVLRALTVVRWQTAEDRRTGAPASATLRSTRLVRRGLRLHAPLTWLTTPTPADLSCLALCALATRHAGLGRNRGAGHVALSLDGDRARTVDLAWEALSREARQR